MAKDSTSVALSMPRYSLFSWRMVSSSTKERATSPESTCSSSPARRSSSFSFSMKSGVISYTS
ncbi:hypothetical protein D3C75_1377530 [compost metagenome]